MSRILFIVLLFLLSQNEKANSQIVINEILASNQSNLENPLTQEYDDWIELYNSSDTDFDLSYHYLSDNLAKPNKWQFPFNTIIKAKSYLIIWANNASSGLNTNFSLSAQGEEVGLFSPTLLLLDGFIYGQQISDISFGRKTDNISEKVFLNAPTPNSSNSSSKSYLGIAEKPTFTQKSGFYNSLTVEILSNPQQDTIYYTTDNSTPTKQSKIYINPIVITKNTNLRAASIKHNYLNSFTVSSSYFINENEPKLPTWSIVSDSTNLYGTVGIYDHPWTDGLEHDVDNIFIEENSEQFKIKSGLRIQGGNSVGMPKKSFREFYRSALGDEFLNYKLFSHSNLSYFKNTVLRAGYDDDLTDSYGTLLRDPLSSDLWRKSGALASLSDWSVLFLNMKYWGIYNIRESVNEYFIEHHTGETNFELIRYQKSGSELKYGDGSEWEKLTNFFNTTDFTQENAYHNAAEFIDMDNFINLLSFVHCAQYRSWTWGSFAYKDYSPTGKWRWTIWDTDRAYSTLSWNGFTEYQYLSAEKWANFMPQKLLKNTIFKNKLINRTADLLNTIFLAENAISNLDSLQNIIEPEIQKEIDRWTSISSSTWQSRVQNIRNFLTQRPTTVRNQILSYFSLSGSKEITLSIQGKGKIKINTITPKTFPWNGIYFNGVAIDLTAIPENGYKFQNWTDSENSSNKTIQILPDNFSEITAIFVEDLTPNNDKPLIINEINYNSNLLFDTKDWIEIYNPNPSNVDLNGWILKDENDLNQFIFKESTQILAQDFLVICKDTNEFKTRFPEVKNYVGNTSFGFGESDAVQIFNSASKLVDFVSYSSSIPWDQLANGSGATLELISPERENELAKNWISFANYFGTPGKINRSISNQIETAKHTEILTYPNPVFDCIYIELNNSAEKIVQIIDISGKIHFKQNYFAKEIDIQLHFLPKGLYILQIITEKEIFNRKIIKK